MIIGFLLKVIIALLVLSLLIFIHELGHFLFAKWNKVAVLEFAVGFGKVVWQKKIGVTRYSLRLIPLGGFVRMAGDDYNRYYFDEEGIAQEIESDEKFTVEPTPELSEEDQKIVNNRDNWFFNKSILRRSSIVFAGPLFNILLAWVLVVFVYLFYGANSPLSTPVIGDLIPDYPAEEAGLMPGDYINSIDGNRINSWEHLVATLKKSTGEPVQIEVLRNTNTEVERLDLMLTPKPENEEIRILEGQENEPKRFLIGIQPSMKKETVGFGEAIISSAYNIYFTSELTVKSFWYLIVGRISATNIGGPITIMNEVGKSADKGLERLIMFTVFISISLGILNLMPIPVLDGGHLLFFLLEAITGGRLNKKFLEYANQAGMIALLALMIFAVGNDLFRLTQ